MSTNVDEEPVLPVYQPPTRSHSQSTSLSSTRGDRSLDRGLPSGFPSLGSTLHYPQSFLHMEPLETFTYAYNLVANDTQLHIFILVESEPDRPGHYTFSLSMRIGDVECALSTPVTMKLSIDPRQLDFVVFVFPPRRCLPTGCLYYLRVWLRTGGIDHRLFADKDIWFGKDPDFRAIADASFAYLRNATQDMSIYQGMVGHAHVSFIFRWTLIEPGTYALSFDYEAGGAGRTLFENCHLRLYCEPQSVSFLIYTIPVPSSPTGASHRLRVWLRMPQPKSPPLPLEPSVSHLNGTPHTYLYQRLWKSDDFKIGARLSFESVGSKIILATPCGGGGTSLACDPTYDDDPRTPRAAAQTQALVLTPNRRRPLSRLVTPSVGVQDASESVSDC
ncbi:hypothetical protein V8E55_001499 [Tylopilus felleus]